MNVLTQVQPLESAASPAREVATAPAGSTPATTPRYDARTRNLLEAPIVPLLLRLAWPNIVVMAAQASTGLVETWFVGKLGTDALAGMALVFPGLMLMTMISAGGMGGGISSAVARALGAGRRDEANALVLHALVINTSLALVFTIVMLVFGRPIYVALGGRAGALDAALLYSDVVFSGVIFIWLVNAFASVIRGTGNMLMPAIVTFAGLVALVPLSPILIFGWGPIPAFGIAGGGIAIVLYNAASAAVLGYYVLSGRNAARFVFAPLRWRPFADIFRVGAAGSISAILTNATIGATTALIGTTFGGEALAGYGTAARLEYLLVPLVFGFGAPLVALVGTNIGAGQRSRALRIAWIGAGLSFAMCEIVGVAAAIFPGGWLHLFGTDPVMVATGSTYLRIAGPCYGFFGLGLSLYFASQGAGRLMWPLSAGFLRLIVAVGGGWIALRAIGSQPWIFAAIAAGMVIYAVVTAGAIARGAWFSGRKA